MVKPCRELELARAESRGPLLAELAAAQADAARERAGAEAAAEQLATLTLEAARAAVDSRRHRKEAARWEAHAAALQQCAHAAGLTRPQSSAPLSLRGEPPGKAQQPSSDDLC